jgi:Tfp pilus assembly protein PilF
MTGKTRKQQIEEMLVEEPNDAELRYALAMEHVSAGDDAEAVRCLGDLSAAIPEYVPAYFQHARALIRLGRQGDARPTIEQGIAAARKKGEFHAADELQGLLDSLE